MDLENGVRRRAQERRLADVTALRAFKSAGRKGYLSPKAGDCLPSKMEDKQNSKNNGNRGQERSADQLNKGGGRAKSSHRPSKQGQLTELSTNAALTSHKGQNQTKDQHGRIRGQDIIAQGISKDGLYQVTSRALHGEDLRRAVELEHKMNLKAKRSAMKQLSAVGEPKLHSIFAEPSKTSSKQNGVVRAYAVNTHQGISRNYNQDRVSIILNISKHGVKAAYFAVYDGHGGSTCCDFLSERLHQLILGSKKFPSHPRQAIVEGLREAETQFLEATRTRYSLTQELDRSGSCALIAVVVGNDIFIANLGDSRAVLSTCGGKPLYSLSRDHKPTDAGQQARIFRQGGRVYRTEMQKTAKGQLKNEKQKGGEHNNDVVLGPLRVFPGKLSVTRTLGDIEAKLPQFGGVRNCIGTEPEICKYSLTGKEDFILLGCDGIFERMDSEEVAEECWRHLKKSKQTDLHQACGEAAEGVVNACMRRKSTDNLTVILIYLGFENSAADMADYRSV